MNTVLSAFYVLDSYYLLLEETPGQLWVDEDLNHSLMLHEAGEGCAWGGD